MIYNKNYTKFKMLLLSIATLQRQSCNTDVFDLVLQYAGREFVLWSGLFAKDPLIMKHGQSSTQLHAEFVFPSTLDEFIRDDF